ncbi:hypothetical protein FNB79_11915 [Formosa sediminum]|uniref:Uncharacterized protein n=1 Tax=Formosa sediminum TaxID=2594004 RepID=A0A516GSZ4_9FLAO|nr:hypothetical protein [Formosa sediminum]QDO94264.1 hypothetical protein FNB79_09880 [Formosa sediminum]QDO94634.1 hypothetical protein FNB79_11915 [Formosa sediminum]
MKEKLELLENEFKDLTFELKEEQFHYLEEGIKKEDRIYVSGFKGNSEFQIVLKPDDDIDLISDLLRKELFIFTDFLAIKYENTIEVLLTTISYRTSFRNIEFDEDVNRAVVCNIGMNYFKNDLNILLEIGEDNTLPKFIKFVRGAFRYSRRRPTILKIENFKKESPDGVINDVRSIINSVLFDIEYNYDIALETVNIDGLLRRYFRRRRKKNELPSEKFNLVYKKYIPELIQYFHIAEKVDFLPFKFICYYHIIEYFSDKSAYDLVSKEVKKILLKPDFHIKTDKYVTTAINLFKKENDRHTNDKVKIERVLKQYIRREELKESIEELELIEHFSEPLTFDCVKPLKLPAIDFEKEGNFFGELTKRIYSTRCSIVHSNPDFDESKAVPFNPSPGNIDKLRIEIEIISQIARTIIIESKENN